MRAHPSPAPRAGRGWPGLPPARWRSPRPGPARAAISPAGYQIALGSSPCPASAHGILPLRPGSVAGAGRRALVFAKAPTGVKPGGKIMASSRSAFAGGRGGQAGLLCGAKAARPTAVVQLLFPWLLPPQSPSQQVVFAGWFHRGYRAWSTAHQRT